MATKKTNIAPETELQPEVVLDMLAKRGLIAENATDPERIKKAKQEQLVQNLMQNAKVSEEEARRMLGIKISD